MARRRAARWGEGRAAPREAEAGGGSVEERGVCPHRSGTLGEAPWAINSKAKGTRPRKQARCRGVRPRESWTLTAARAERRRRRVEVAASVGAGWGEGAGERAEEGEGDGEGEEAGCGEVSGEGEKGGRAVVKGVGRAGVGPPPGSGAPKVGTPGIDEPGIGAPEIGGRPVAVARAAGDAGGWSGEGRGGRKGGVVFASSAW
jgi:hypothetical protein